MNRQCQVCLGYELDDGCSELCFCDEGGNLKIEIEIKVGDIICRNHNGYPLLVTAVGVKRFLYVAICTSARKECVATKYQSTAQFRKWNPDRWPDSQYSYITEVDFDKWNILQGIEIKFPPQPSRTSDTAKTPTKLNIF